MTRAPIAVLAIGGGSNFQALLDHFAQLGERRAGDVVVLATDRENTGASQRASAVGIPAIVTRSRLAPAARELTDVFDEFTPSLIVLAGYLQLIPAELTRRFRGRIVNVHPAPLPQFGGAGMYGARVHRAVVAANTSLSGPTVHFVDDQYDHGPSIAHWRVPVIPGDDEHALGARVLRAEHLLFPRVVQALAAGELCLSPDAVVSPPFLKVPLPTFDPSLDDAQLARIVDDART